MILPANVKLSSQPAAEPPATNDDGVDVTLIRWFLSLTPLERLRTVQRYAESIMKLRDANPHL